MKIKLLSIIALAILITVVGCKKITETETMNDVKPIPKDKTTQKIINFAQKVKKVKLGEKSGDETMSVEDAKWNIEAALNYYNYPEQILDNVEMVKEEMVRDISPVDNKLTLSEITEIAIEMNASINDDPSKEFLAADIEVVDKEDGTKAMKMTTMKARTAAAPTEDTWSYWSMGGSCVNDYPLSWGSPEILRALVNQFAFGGWYARHHLIYYTDVQTVFATNYSNDPEYMNPNDDTSGDDYEDYYLYRSHEDNPHCLTETEMDFYSQIGIPAVITIEKPAGKNFMNVTEIVDDFPLCDDCSSDWNHSIYIEYGIAHDMGPIDPNPNPLDE